MEELFEEKKCCGTCQWHTPMPLNEWYCDNEESENYSNETDYEFYCEDWEEREYDLLL